MTDYSVPGRFIEDGTGFVLGEIGGRTTFGGGGFYTHFGVIDENGGYALELMDAWGGVAGARRPADVTERLFLLVDGAITTSRSRGAGTIHGDGRISCGEAEMHPDGRVTSGTSELSPGGLLSLHGPAGGGLVIKNAAGTVDNIAFDGEWAQLRLGWRGRRGHLEIYGENGRVAVRLDGTRGTIWSRNSDCAEHFNVAADEQHAEPGSLLVMDDEGVLRSTDLPYDRRAVGAVSGAGDTEPGVLLGEESIASVPIALAGRVTCKVIAGEHPVQVGDPIVTSALPGFGMAGTDPDRAQGAVIGKALAPLKRGRGMVPVLVAPR
jgi:hypothetical protein